MTGNKRERFLFMAIIFHELTGKFDCVPGYTINAGDRGIIYLAQHMMQAMSKFMKQGHDIIMCQQGFMTIHWRHEIAGKIGNWQLDPVATDASSNAAFIHPGSITFVCACIEINIKTRAQVMIFIMECK